MFSIREAFAVAWGACKEHTGFLICVHVIALAVQTIPQLLMGDSPGIRALVVIVSMLGSFVVALGLVRIGLNVVDGTENEYGDLFGQAHLVFKYLIATLLHGLAAASVPILIGAALVSYNLSVGDSGTWSENRIAVVFAAIVSIIPAAIVYARFSQWPFLMVEEGLGPIRAMRESSRLTEGSRGRLILFFLATIPVMIAGLIALVVGFLVSYAVITVAMAQVYRQLQARLTAAVEVTP